MHTNRVAIARLASRAGMLAALAFASPLAAAPITAVGGFDHYAGASGQTTNGWLGAVVFAAAGGDLTLAGVRFDDSVAGTGTSVTGGVGLPIAPMMMLRAAGTRFVGDGDLRAWRFKIGPQFSLSGGRSVTVSYAYYRDHLGARSNAGIAEAGVPLVARLAGRAGASIAAAPGGAPVLQGSAGLAWTVAPHVELSGEAGMVNSEAGAVAPGSPGGGPLGGLPLIGGGGGSGGTTETTRSTYGTLSLGVRVTWP